MTVDRRRFLLGAGATLALPALSGCEGIDRVPVPGVTPSGFDASSTAEEVTEGIDLSGKLAVVTGCTSGIGFETMRVLAKRGAYVIGTSRSLERATEASLKVIGLTTPLALDLADPASVVRFANNLVSMNTPIDILVCNAGYLGGGNERQLVNGVEKHFAVNHLGHFILVNRLLERLYRADQGRIVIVSSRAAYKRAPEEGILFDDLAMENDYTDLRAYGHSKLANALFSLHLAKLLRGTRITTNALHPGVIDTEIDRNLGVVKRLGFSLMSAVSGKTIEEGAATTCYVATAPALGNVSGRYFEDCNAITIEGRGHMQNEAMAEKLMAVSESLTFDHLVEQHDGNSSGAK